MNEENNSQTNPFIKPDKVHHLLPFLLAALPSAFACHSCDDSWRWQTIVEIKLFKFIFSSILKWTITHPQHIIGFPDIQPHKRTRQHIANDHLRIVWVKCRETPHQKVDIEHSVQKQQDDQKGSGYQNVSELLIVNHTPARSLHAHVFCFQLRNPRLVVNPEALTSGIKIAVTFLCQKNGIHL